MSTSLDSLFPLDGIVALTECKLDQPVQNALAPVRLALCGPLAATPVRAAVVAQDAVFYDDNSYSGGQALIYYRDGDFTYVKDELLDDLPGMRRTDRALLSLASDLLGRWSHNDVNELAAIVPQAVFHFTEEGDLENLVAISLLDCMESQPAMAEPYGPWSIPDQIARDLVPLAPAEGSRLLLLGEAALSQLSAHEDLALEEILRPLAPFTRDWLDGALKEGSYHALVMEALPGRDDLLLLSGFALDNNETWARCPIALFSRS